MWESLVGEKPGGQKEEILRYENISKHYESENVRLKLELEESENSKISLIQSLKEGEKIRNELTRKIKSLEKSIKFDKIASDGIAKKAAIFEFETGNLKEERSTLIEEQIFSRKRVKDFERSLYEDRAKLLKEMHESEIRMKKLEELESKYKLAESELLLLRIESLDKVQRLDTLSIAIESQNRIMQAQSEEILSLTSTLTDMKEAIQRLNDLSYQQQEKISEKNKDRNNFEQEVFRLRSELMRLAHSQTEKSLLHNGVCRNSIGRSRSGDLGGYSTQYAASNSIYSSSSSSRREVMFSASPSASPFKPYASLVNVNANTSTVTGNRDRSVDNSTDTYMNVNTSNSTVSTALSSSNNSNKLSHRSRTQFLGAGLGLRNDETHFSSPSGSAKQVLKKIMEDFNNNH